MRCTFSVGQIASAYGTVAPTLPATTINATVVRARAPLMVKTVGASVELEGKVSLVTTSPASFVIRGVTVDASALASLPAVGDVVRVVGSIAGSGCTVTASTSTVVQLAGSKTYGFEGDLESVVPGYTGNTYFLKVLGETISVSATARLADRSGSGSGGAYSNGYGYSSNYSGYGNTATSGTSGTTLTNPFNITTFQSYLAASTSKHVQVRVTVDPGGNLNALSVTILPASTVSAISGIVDGSPVFNSATTGTPTTFSMNGIAVSADPSSIVKGSYGRYTTTTPATTAPTIAACDLVTVRGTYASSKFTVAATTSTPSTTTSPHWGNSAYGYYGSYGAYGSYGSYTNQVIDSGVPTSLDFNCF